MSVTLDRSREFLAPSSPRPPVYVPADVERVFGPAYTPDQRVALEAVPFPEDVLWACAGTHLLVAGAPLSLLDLRERRPELFFGKMPAWYDHVAERSWAARPPEARWYLLRKGPAPGTMSMTFAEQRARLAPREEVPRTYEVVLAVLIHHKLTVERLQLDVYVRCADKRESGNCVIVGRFDDSGLDVEGFWGDYPDSSVGLASARTVP